MAPAMPKAARAEAFRKKNEITAKSTAVNVAFTIVKGTDGRRSRMSAAGMRISLISMDDTKVFYSSSRDAAREEKSATISDSAGLLPVRGLPVCGG